MKSGLYLFPDFLFHDIPFLSKGLAILKGLISVKVCLQYTGTIKSGKSPQDKQLWEKYGWVETKC